MTMKSVKRPIDTSFWEDNKIVDQFTPEDKLFFLYLLSNPHTSQTGIYHLGYKVAAFELGYSIAAVKSLLDRFENRYHVILYSKEHQEIAVLNALKHNIVKGGKPVEDCIRSELQQVQDVALIQFVYNHLISFWNESNRKIDGAVELIFREQLNKRKEPKENNLNENDIDNENENDNERIVTDSSAKIINQIQNQLNIKINKPKKESLNPYLSRLNSEDIDDAILATLNADRPSFHYFLGVLRNKYNILQAKQKVVNRPRIPVYKLGE